MNFHIVWSFICIFLGLCAGLDISAQSASYAERILSAKANKNVRELNGILTADQRIPPDTLALILHTIGVINYQNQNYCDSYHATVLAYEMRKSFEKVDSSDLLNSLNNLRVLANFYDGIDRIALLQNVTEWSYFDKKVRKSFELIIEHYENLSDWTDALHYSDKELKLYNDFNQKESELQALNRRAGIFLKIDQPYFDSIGQRLLYSAMDTAMKYPDLSSELYSIYNNLAIVSRRKGDFERAIPMYERVLRLIGEDENLTKKTFSNWSKVSNNLAYALIEEGRYEAGIEILHNILSEGKKLDLDLKSPKFFSEYLNLSEGYMGIGLFEKSDSALRRAFHCIVKDYSTIDDLLSTRGVSDIEHRTLFAQGLKDYFELYESWERLDQDQSARCDQIEKAGQLFFNSLLLSDFGIDAKRIWQAHAREFYTLALKRSLELNRLNQSVLYSDLLRMNITSNALRQRAMARCIPDTVGLRIDHLRTEMHKLRQLINDGPSSAKVDSLNDVRINCEYEMARLIDHIRVNHRDCFESSFLRATSMNQPLVPDMGIIEYSFVDTYLVSIDIFADTVSIRKCSGKKVRNHVYKFLRSIRVSDLEAIEEHGSILRKILLDSNALMNQKQLIIVPDGLLSYVPFDLLLCPEKDLGSGNCNRDIDISYCFSLDLHNQISNSEVGSTRPLFVAPFNSIEPTESRRSQRLDLVPLRKSLLEIENADKSIDGEMLILRAATRDSFLALAPSYGILHLATHAVVDDENVDFSCIYFQPEEGDSLANRLYLNDLYAMNLPLEMVVLSACETGVGELLKGEGMLSLANGFTQAGAKSVITSLWKADDESTYKIMTAFYKYLARGQRKDEALRNAKLEYLENCDPLKSSPYYWAAFIPIGDMSPIRAKPLYLQWGFWLMIGVAVLGVWGYRRHLIDCKKAA